MDAKAQTNRLRKGSCRYREHTGLEPNLQWGGTLAAITARKNSSTDPAKAETGQAVGSGEARRCGEPIPCGGGRWEPPERAGSEYLRRKSAVNVGRASGKERESEERSRRTASSPGCCGGGRRVRGTPEAAPCR
jgi:hypothetical protein